MQIRKLISTVAILAVAVSAITVFAQDAQVQFKWMDSEGDAVKVIVDSHIDMQIRGEDIDEMEIDQDVKVVRHQEFSQTVRKVDEGALATILDVNCTSATWEQNGGANPTRGVVDSTISGQNFTVIRDGQTYTVEVQGNADVAPRDVQGIGNWFELRHLLPQGQVAVGTSWDVAADKVISLIIQEFTATESSLTCTLRDIVGEGQNRVAIIRIVGDFRGSISESLAATSTVTGEFQFNIATGSPVRFSANALLEASGELVEQGSMLGKITAKAQKLEYTVEFK